MTPQELNRDIKRLASSIHKASQKSNEEYFAFIEGEAKKEFSRLYNADREFTYMNLASIRTMLRLNVKHRFIPFHQFGLYIELDGE